MTSFLRWIVALPLIVAAILFALANREHVLLTFSPFHEPTMVPLYLVGLLMLTGGFIMGVVACWLGTHNIRKDRRDLRKTVKTLEKELVEANERHPVTPPEPSAPLLPGGYANG